MQLLYLDASAKGERYSSGALGRHFIAALERGGVELEIAHLNLTLGVPAHVTSDFTVAT